MDEGRPPQECGAGEEEESPRMAVAEDHSLLNSSNLNHEDRQDVADSHTEDTISENIGTQVAVKMLISLQNLRQQNADIHVDNMAPYWQIESLRQTLKETKKPVDELKDGRKEMLNLLNLKQENEALKSEMSSVLHEGEKKTKKILDKLIDAQWAQQQQLEEEHRFVLDKNSQDLREKSMIIKELLATIQELRTNHQNLKVQLEKAMAFGVDQPIAKAEALGQLPHSYVEGPDVEKEEERELEQSLDGIQEQSPVSRRAQVQTKSWWRRQAKGLRKVVRRMGTSCSCISSNQVHPVSEGMLPV